MGIMELSRYVARAPFLSPSPTSTAVARCYNSETTKNLRTQQCCRLSIMSSRKVVLDGVTYIRSRDAARAVNLALDYVSRLARHGAISGQRVSGIWFVDLASLQNFIVEQERQKES